MAVVPTPPTITSSTSSSSVMNQFRDAINFLQRKPLAKMRQATLQTITTGAYTGLACDAEDYDSDVGGNSGHDNVTNNSRYTANYPGWYRCSAGIAWAGNVTARRGGRFAVNGTAVAASGILIAATLGTGLDLPFDTNLVFLNAGDYCEAQAFQDSGGNLNTLVGGAGSESASRFIMEWVSN